MSKSKPRSPRKKDNAKALIEEPRCHLRDVPCRGRIQGRSCRCCAARSRPPPPWEPGNNTTFKEGRPDGAWICSLQRPGAGSPFVPRVPSRGRGSEGCGARPYALQAKRLNRKDNWGWPRGISIGCSLSSVVARRLPPLPPPQAAWVCARLVVGWAMRGWEPAAGSRVP